MTIQKPLSLEEWETVIIQTTIVLFRTGFNTKGVPSVKNVIRKKIKEKIPPSDQEIKLIYRFLSMSREALKDRKIPFPKRPPYTADWEILWDVHTCGHSSDYLRYTKQLKKVAKSIS